LEKLKISKGKPKKTFADFKKSFAELKISFDKPDFPFAKREISFANSGFPSAELGFSLAKIGFSLQNRLQQLQIRLFRLQYSKLILQPLFPKLHAQNHLFSASEPIIDYHCIYSQIIKGEAEVDTFVNSTDSIGMRLRAARERLGLSTEQAAAQMRMTPEALSLMEIDDDEIGSSCTLADVARFAGVLQTTSRDLFGIPMDVPPLKPAALDQLIHEYCQEHAISVQQFEDKVAWPAGIKNAELSSILIADICRELGVDWRRVFASYDVIAA
jgi:transcriptional regulator with XRE-family HTH domain